MLAFSHAPINESVTVSKRNLPDKPSDVKPRVGTFGDWLSGLIDWKLPVGLALVALVLKLLSGRSAHLLQRTTAFIGLQSQRYLTCCAERR